MVFDPYADNLRQALRRKDGHYTRGLGDGKNGPKTALELLPGAVDAAEQFLATDTDAAARLDKVEGFKTPFGMEQVGTVYGVMHRAQRRTISPT